MDVRDFAWWDRKARIENAKKKINALGTVRLAMHGDDSYTRQVHDLIDQIELLEYVKPSDEENLRDWEATVDRLKSFMGEVKGKMRR